jgi:hypothetical protein
LGAAARELAPALRGTCYPKHSATGFDPVPSKESRIKESIIANMYSPCGPFGADMRCKSLASMGRLGRERAR